MSFSFDNNFKLNLNDEKSLREFLSRHSLIEASAGTGKTYTIVKLVEFIIKEGLANPDEILIVTFTEKAAGEIKDRIYQNFVSLLEKEEINNFEFLRIRVEYALNNINKFHINTIHGFCNYLINNYPFEIGLSFSNEVINESEILKNSFFSYLRKGLFEDIRDVLKNFEDNNISFLNNFKNLYFEDKKYKINNLKTSCDNFIDSIAKELLSFFSFRSYFFDYSNNKNLSTSKSIKDFLNYINKILYIFPYLYKDYIFGEKEKTIKYFSILFYKLYINLIIFNEIKNIIIKLENEKILDLDKDEKFKIIDDLLKIDLKKIYPEFKNYFDDIERKIIEIELNKEIINGELKKQSKKALLDFLSNLVKINKEKGLTNHDFYQLIEGKVNNETQFIYYFKIFLFFYFSYIDLFNFFVNFLCLRVFQLAKETKESTNRLSFNDMIHYVFNAVNNSEVFLKTLKNKYKYCFIDEFQDTDPIQWEIFKKIFVEENVDNKADNLNRIILIGDPKQSIYYFRNADLRTYFRAKNEILNRGGYFVKLDKNFRSTNGIISISNILFDDSYFNIENNSNLIQTYQIYKGENSIEIKCNIEEDLYKGAYFVNIEEIGDENKNIENESKNENKSEIKKDESKKYNKLDSKRKQILFLDFIGNEILDILEKDKYLIKTKSDLEFRKIKASDIAILVSSRNDAQNIQKYLFDKYGIDSVIYKKSLLYQSDEAIQVYLLLDYISEPENIEKLRKLLFTDFFYFETGSNLGNFNEKQNVKLNENNKNISNELDKNRNNENNLYETTNCVEIDRLINENEIIINFINEVKKINKRFFQWNFISNFYKILNLENNILKRYGKVKAKNIIINYKHLAEKLEFIAYKEKLDIFSLKNRLLSLIYSSEDDELEEDLFRSYIDDNKINILTIHSAKGLEFPIVFNFAALKKANIRNNYPFYYKDDRIIIEYEIFKMYKENYINNFVIEEYRRLHYVAFTRAIFLVYTPVFIDNVENYNIEKEDRKDKDKEDKENNKYEKNKKEIKSNIQLSFSDLLSLDKKKIENNIIIFSKETALNFSNNFKNNLIFEAKKKIFEDKNNYEKLEIIKVPEDFEKKVSLINQKNIKLFSFSSIHRKENIKKIEDIEKILKTLEDENYKEDVLLENETDLPPGEKTGSMFHEIMEEIDYRIGYEFEIEDKNKKSKYKELEDLVRDKINKYFGEYDKAQKNEFLKKTISMIKSVLDLSIIEPNFFIKDIKKDDRINELEFYIKSGDSFINGFIDLIFRKNINGETKYFIIDWKTNIVENNNKDNNKNKNKNNNNNNNKIYIHFEENYYLQAKIYEYAFFKYILSTKGIYFFEYKDIEKNIEMFKNEYYKVMGGIIYIYTREVLAEGNGLVFLQPDFNRFASFVRDIENNLEEKKY